jgi:transcriptional regulator with XRE-family HTH domain
MSPRNKDVDYERLVAQEALILDATEAIVSLLEEKGVSRQELAKRLGKSKSFVTQILSGERNMTLRTLADVGYALGHTFSLAPATPAAESEAALRDLFKPLSAGMAWGKISTDAVRERLRAAEDAPVDVHEYALAA